MTGHAAIGSWEPPHPVDRSEADMMFKRGDPPPFGSVRKGVTIERLMRAGATCRIACDECGHEAVHSALWLVNSYGLPLRMPLYQAAQFLRCRNCRSSAVSIETAPNG